MSFGLKNAGATYMKAMTTIFHDMIYKEIEVYADDVIIKSKRNSDHIAELKRMLKKDVAISWTEECQKAFDKSKEYLSKPPILVPPEPRRSLLLYLFILEGNFGCVLGQHDETGRKEHAIYYLRKKFMPYEARYSLMERTCCALTWISQKLRHYFYAYTTYLISRMDPLKYIFQKPMPTGKLAKWKILFRKFDIIWQKNLINGEYKPLKMYFPDEEVSFVGEYITKAYDGWRMFFYGSTNFKGVGIRAVLVSETGQHYPISAKLKFPCTNNMAEYEACILGLRLAIDMNVQELMVIRDSDLLVHQNEFADALATLSSMIQQPNKNFIYPFPIGIQKQPAYCAHIEEDIDGNPWFHDIKKYPKKGEYPNTATPTQKRILRRLANYFFQSGGILYRRTPDLGLLRRVDA
ncbi:uncharacterized protein [Nicotiana tomentosiformis]|uniref:uncharacterized protein n=1 Tax=Nicotiana tomentosiformis TaxID=4098 RepID=UPI00388CA16D